MNNWPMPDRHVPHGFGPMLPNEAGFFCKFWIPFSPSAHPLPVTASKRRATVFLRTGCSWSHACFVTSVPAAFKQNLPFQNVFPARTHAPKASPPALCLAYHHPYIRSLKPSLPLLLPFKQEIRSFFSFLTVHFRYQPEQPPDPWCCNCCRCTWQLHSMAGNCWWQPAWKMQSLSRHQRPYSFRTFR